MKDRAGTFSHVLVFAKDLEKLVAFYRDAFAMTRRDTSDPGYVEMTVGGAVALTIHALPPDIARSITVSTPPAWRDESALKICFATTDLAAGRQRIVDLGGQAKEIWSWDGRSLCECTDPEGNVIQLFEPTTSE